MRLSWRWAAAGSIRSKLLAMVLLPLCVVLPLLGLLLLAWSNAALDRLLVAKVRADLAVASGYFERMQARIGASASALADSRQLHTALGPQAQALPSTLPSTLQTLLAELRQRNELDFVQLQRPDGRPWAGDAGLPGASLPLPQHSTPAQPLARVALLEGAALAALSPELRQRVAVDLLPTRNAGPSPRRREERALLLLASAPVLSAGGQLLGYVQAGVLLNRNLGWIDQLNDIVYPAGALPWHSQGTATLFLDDVRISTNVRLFGATSEGQPDRAIGTRVSSAVREAVLGQGQTWLGRAFVVDAWYVSGYLPLLAERGERVGMLYVGFSEAPFNWLKYGALASIGLIFFAVMLGAGWVSLRWARSIFQPLERMSAVMQQVEAGQTQARVGALSLPSPQACPGQSGDEIHQLAHHFDHLLDVVADKTQALERWNAELDAKVAQRTQELQTTQRQLLRNEKLATMGQLTASIAHEVNNPIAVMQGNLDLVRELLGPQARSIRAELGLMDEQIERMRLLVTQLLQFARPTEFAGYTEALAPAQVLSDCLVLVAHWLGRQNIQVQRQDHATRCAHINRQELQQVLVNLLVNAAQAMPHGGTLTLSSHDWGEHGVAIEVADSGPGLPPELLGELFEPFVSGKPEGTGLGLWISRSLVERYGGELHASNRPEGGACLRVLLTS